MSVWGEDQETFEEIAATIAHEIKNPLALALANLDIIKISDIDGQFKKNCAVIEKELFKINQLVLDLIHIARSDDPDVEFDLSAMLDEVINEYRHMYESINFESTSVSQILFTGLPKKIRLIFTNILNNAVDAVSDGGRIRLETEIEPYSIKISIKDNGRGISDSDLINMKFYTTKTNGTGMGLHYCRTTAAHYGGRFTIQNLPEGGCVAIVELPKKGQT
ncbi:MAG: HAMP domain-containing histidine kinase [Clostridiales bacterium]|jgi:two-component system sporulation sensor kinase A|nr:HAMP domain-containing histidine kinase [Clostridiales bacterium]